MPLHRNEIYCLTCEQPYQVKKTAATAKHVEHGKYYGQFGYHKGDVKQCECGNFILTGCGAEITRDAENKVVDFQLRIKG